MSLLNMYATEAKSDLQFWRVYAKNKPIISMVLHGPHIYILQTTTQASLSSYKVDHFYTGKTPDINTLWIKRKPDYEFWAVFKMKEKVQILMLLGQG